MEILVGVYLLCTIWINYESCAHLKELRRLICKQITSLLFVLTFIYIYLSTRTISIDFYVLLTAFIMSFIGDLFLGLYNYHKYNKMTKYFLLGTGLFFAAQIVFILYFAVLNNVGFSILYIIAPIIMSIGVYFILHLGGVKKKSIMIVSIIYCFALSSMLISTIKYFVLTGNYFALIGGCLFAISDMTLAVKYFTPIKGKWLVILTTSTYYLAQLSFCLSLCLK